MTYLQDCINYTRVNEGGVSNNPHDRGGLTNLGITLDTLREASAKVHGHSFDKNHDGKIDGVDLLSLNDDDVLWIVKECGFWSPLLDRLPKGVAIKTFDLRFNCGITSGTKLLQKAIDRVLADAVVVDGVIGTETVAMANKIDQYVLYRVLVDTAIKHYVAIAKYDASQIGNLNGWINRAKRVPYPDPNFALSIA